MAPWGPEGVVRLRPVDDRPGHRRLLRPDQRFVSGGRCLHAAPRWRRGRPALPESGGWDFRHGLDGRQSAKPAGRAVVRPEPADRTPLGILVAVQDSGTGRVGPYAV